jgi:hypothetical protein
MAREFIDTEAEGLGIRFPVAGFEVVAVFRVQQVFGHLLGEAQGLRRSGTVPSLASHGCRSRPRSPRRFQMRRCGGKSGRAARLLRRGRAARRHRGHSADAVNAAGVSNYVSRR